MAPYYASLMYSQLLVSIPEQTSDFSGQTVIVTGSNTGLGLEAARLLVRLNAAKVILAVRTISKGEKAAADIIRSCHTDPSRVEVWQLDISNKDSIKAFAQRANGLDRLDAVIQNAGVLSMKWSEIDGVESHIAVNVVGALLLQLQLLPILQASAAKTGMRGRLAVVGSDMMYPTDPAKLKTEGSMLAHVNNKAAWGDGYHYQLSKLLLYYATRRIAALHPVSEKSNVLITVQTPGACKSDIFRDDLNIVFKAVMMVMQAIVARTTEVGGRTLVHAVSPELPAEAHGRFLMDCKIDPHRYSMAEQNEVSKQMEQKWNDEIFPYLEMIEPGVTKV